MAIEKKKRAMVKLDGRVFEITFDKSGANARELPPDMVFEETVLGDGFEKLFKNNLNSIFQDAQADLERSLKAGIKNTTLRALGFEEDSWSRGWKVDHCNGRMSVVSEHITNSVRTLFRDEINPYIESHKKEIMDEVKQSIRTELTEVMRREARSCVHPMAIQAAQHLVQSILQDEVEKFKREAVLQVRARLLGMSVKELPPPAEGSENP